MIDSLQKTAASPELIAANWFARLAAASAATMPLEEPLPQQSLFVLAAFAALALAQGRTLVILVPDDEPLPEISNALDLSLRPLCLVIPGADFAARIALRATLSLMKSRLSRDANEEQAAAWQRQQARISANQPLWEDAQQWLARNDRSDWPAQIAELFPARILPIAAYRTLQQKTTDITLLYRCDAPPELLAPPGSLLRIGARAETPRNRALTPADESVRLQMELAQLTQDVAELELELATAQGEVADFTRRYYQLVGRRMVELDALQAMLAEQQANQAPDDRELRHQGETKRKKAEQSAREGQRFTHAAADEPTTFRPNVDVKRLFRQIAQKIHPDRAADEADRAWRTQLMSEANRAYRAGDQAALREVVTLWEEGRHNDTAGANTSANASVSAAPSRTTPPAENDRLARIRDQIGRLRARFIEIERELHRLFGSRLYELFIAARQAERQGRNLLREMAEKLDASIAQARSVVDGAPEAGAVPA